MPKQPPVAVAHSDRLSGVNSDVVDMKDFVLVRDEAEARALGCAAILFWDDDKLSLKSFADEHFKPLTIDWSQGKVDYRRKQGGRGEMILKAVGVKQGYLPTVVDATAGLGSDSFILALAGCTVTMVERSPVVRALLWDGLKRAAETSETADIAQRLSLVAADARGYLHSIVGQQPPAVVFCDPMFPERKKSALVKKEMRVFKLLVGDDGDADELISHAINTATKRVVVKRPRKAPPLGERLPSHSLEGKACRYDIYMIS